MSNGKWLWSEISFNKLEVHEPDTQRKIYSSINAIVCDCLHSQTNSEVSRCCFKVTTDKHAYIAAKSASRKSYEKLKLWNHYLVSTSADLCRINSVPLYRNPSAKGKKITLKVRTGSRVSTTYLEPRDWTCPTCISWKKGNLNECVWFPLCKLGELLPTRHNKKMKHCSKFKEGKLEGNINGFISHQQSLYDWGITWVVPPPRIPVANEGLVRDPLVVTGILGRGTTLVHLPVGKQFHA